MSNLILIFLCVIYGYRASQKGRNGPVMGAKILGPLLLTEAAIGAYDQATGAPFDLLFFWAIAAFVFVLAWMRLEAPARSASAADSITTAIADNNQNASPALNADTAGARDAPMNTWAGPSKGAWERGSDFVQGQFGEIRRGGVMAALRKGWVLYLAAVFLYGAIHFGSRLLPGDWGFNVGPGFPRAKDILISHEPQPPHG